MWKGKQRSGPEEEDEAEDRGNGYVFHSFSVSGSVLRSVLGETLLTSSRQFFRVLALGFSLGVGVSHLPAERP